MTFLQNRRTRRQAREILHHARHLRNMRGDLMSANHLARLDQAEQALAETLRGGDIGAVEKAATDLHACMHDLTPSRPAPWLRENLEIVVVAIAVAMAFRTYFLQPFKIPTGSMQPTLYGIHVRSVDGPTWRDRMPFKLANWLVTGDWYQEVRARNDGQFGLAVNSASGQLQVVRRGDEACFILYVGETAYEVPVHAEFRAMVQPGSQVRRGALLWAGIRTAGDHVLVDKVRWNFSGPRRGNVIVFSTKGIPTLPLNTFYIKRLVGLPGETVSVVPPHVVVNGQPVTSPASIARVAAGRDGYDGYQLAPGSYDDEAGRMVPSYISPASPSQTLGPRQYLAFGDNTRNSKDSRFWGTVPQDNLVGPGLVVYWPFINAARGPSRWGLMD